MFLSAFFIVNKRMSDIIKKFQDFFTKLQFFLRIYETKNNIIFWNDRDIMKKVNKIKLQEILQSSSSFETPFLVNSVFKFVMCESYLKLISFIK